MATDALYLAELDDFISDIEAASGPMPQTVVDMILHDMADDIAMAAQRRAPRDTGELAASFRVETGSGYARILNDAQHAMFVEFGTWSHNVIRPQHGTYSIRPKREGGVLRFTAASGNVVHTTKVEHPGVKAQPYLGPAADEVINRDMGKVADAVVLLVVGT